MSESSSMPPAVPESATAEPAAPGGGGAGGKRPWALSELLAWGIIVAMICIGVVETALVKQKAVRVDASERTQMLLVSRYLVGVHHWMKSLNAGDAAQEETFAAEIDRVAKSPPDQLRAAIVRGEIQSGEEARRRIESLRETYPSLQQDAQAAQAIYASENPRAEPEWEGFHSRYGWFAELAAAAGKPAGSAERAAAEGPATRTTITLLGMSLLAIGSGVIGLVLLIIAIVLLARKRLALRFRMSTPPPPPGRMPGDRRAYVQGFALYMVGMVTFGLVIRAVLGMVPGGAGGGVAGIFRMAALPLAFLAGAAWPLLRGQSWGQWRATTGVHGGRGFFREVGAGIVGYFAGFPVFLAGALLTALLVHISGSDASHPVTEELTQGWPMWVVVLLLASAWAPLTEEIMFRGMLFAHLRERFPWWISALVMGFIFAIIHPQGWAALPALGSLAVVFAGIREWRGSIIGCITAHAMHNTVTLIIATLILT